MMIFASCSKPGNTPNDPEHAHEAEHEGLVTLTAEQVRVAGLRLGKLEEKQLSGTIKVNGVLDVPPQQLISISTPMGGFVRNTSLLQGSKVKKGEVIATIENLEFIQLQQDYLEAKTQFELTQADYERQLALAKENVNSKKTIQQAKTAYITWQARYKGLLEKLRILNFDIAGVEAGNFTNAIRLYSPIHGYVTEVNVNIGKFVSPSDVLFEIVDTEHLHAELVIFEKDVSKVKIGQNVRFTLANESKEREATVYLIGREISPDRTIRIHCHIKTEDTEMLPGMYLSALVETGGALVPALPGEAIIDYQGSKFIFVSTGEHHDEVHEQPDDNGTSEEPHQAFHMVEITTGISELGYTEVSLPDSLADAAIVVKGAYSLLSTMKNTEEGGHHH
jgi:cobalt-zinc-cadmium efflux system membrane fusion protein